MSGPIEESDRLIADLGVSTIEVKEGRTTNIGRLGVFRVLPTKGRRTIGPWCFVDLMRPDDVEDPPPLEIGPHPHIGLATVTWLFGGAVLHTDSLGSQQLIRPGELNLMTSGRGIAHAEEGVDTKAPEASSGIMGVQMWIAQTETTRHGDNGFQHFTDLPEIDLGNGSARLFLGEFAGTTASPAIDHPATAIDLQFTDSVTLPVRSDFEYGVVPINRPIRVEEAIVEPGSLALVPPGHEQLRIDTREGSGRVMVLGGEPLGETILMWWNFVARTQDEITEAWRDWETRNEDRFGAVPSSLPRFEAPTPPWVESIE